MEGKKDETRPTSDSSTVKRTSPAKMCVYVLTFFFLKKKVKKRWRSQFHNLIAPWPRPPLCVRLESNSPHTFTSCLTYWDGLVPLQHSEIIIALHTGTIMLYKRVWVAPFECEWYCFSRPPFPFWIRASFFCYRRFSASSRQNFFLMCGEATPALWSMTPFLVLQAQAIYWKLKI